MKATLGDRLIIRGHRQGEHPRDAEVIETLGEDGGPPFRVRWSDDGHVSVLFPGSDASVEHLVHEGPRPPNGHTAHPVSVDSLELRGRKVGALPAALVLIERLRFDARRPRGTPPPMGGQRRAPARCQSRQGRRGLSRPCSGPARFDSRAV